MQKMFLAFATNNERLGMLNSNYQRYSWTTFWIALGILAGVIPIVYFTYFEKLNVGSPLLWAFTYLVMGALLGFIFSVPKIISENSVSQNVNPEIIINPALKTKVEENTNLTQISDWLTKILIGAGLVQLGEAPRFILHVARVMGEGISNVPSKVNSINIFCAAIVLYFLTWGFISGYLVMKLILTEQFADRNNL